MTVTDSDISSDNMASECTVDTCVCVFICSLTYQACAPDAV